MATLGLNPSVREFHTPQGALLTGAKRRLADLEFLGIDNLADATADMLSQVKSDCDTYFSRNPYSWFRPLERLLKGLGHSFYDGSACHLDLVQWATDPVWSGLPRPQREALIATDADFLRRQLQNESVSVVLANGRTVLAALSELVDLSPMGHVTNSALTAALYGGTADGVRYLGWTCNFQSQPGALSLLGPVTQALVPHVSALRKPRATSYIERGMAVASKADLEALLRRWLQQSQEETIGDVGSFGGTPWLYVELPNATVALNADTKRSAIENYLRACGASGAELPWRVITNRNGRINKVVFGEKQPVRGWYAYTVDEQPMPVDL